MQIKHLGILSLICLLVTILWLVSMIVGTARAGSLSTFEQVLAYVGKADAIFYMTYVNVAIVTVVAIMLFEGLYLYYKPIAPAWASLGVIFVPIYGTMNLLVYLSQITVVPQLLKLHAMPEYTVLAKFLLLQTIQQWPGSAVSMFNNLAYAILGVPSVIFGVLMLRSGIVLRVGGILLALSGLFGIVGFVGVVTQSVWFSKGSLIGGIFFLLALVCMSWGYRQE